LAQKAKESERKMDKRVEKSIEKEKVTPEN